MSPIHASNNLETSFQVDRKPLCFHLKAFSNALSKYIRETYASGESDNQWKHHLMNKEKVIQINQLIQYFQRQTKLQQLSPYSLMGLLQQVHLVIRNQESIVCLGLKMSLIVSVITQNRFLIHVESIEQNPIETFFDDDYESLTHGSSWKEINSHVHNRLFDHRHKLFILQMYGTCQSTKTCHGQHHQGHHLQVIDRMYWYIIRERWKVREPYPHQLFV